MSHTKDIDERKRQAEAPEAADLVLMDLLYGELDEGAREQAEQRVREDDALARELDAFSRLRSLMRELPDAEPSEAVSAKLLHAAAAEVATVGARRAHARDDEESSSAWGWLRRLFMPLVLHPGLAAAASLLLVGGVAGMLYVSGRLNVASPRARSEAPAAATAPAAEGVAANEAARAMPDSTDDFGGREQALEHASGAVASQPAAAARDEGGAEEQRQGYFAQAPAEPAALGEGGLGKAGRGAVATEELDKETALARRSAVAPSKQKAEDLDRSSGRSADRVAGSSAGYSGGSAAGSKKSKSIAADELAGDFAVAPGAAGADTRAGTGAGAASGPAGVVGGGGAAPAAPVQQTPTKKPSPKPSATPPPPAAPAAAPEPESAAKEDDAEYAPPADGKAATRDEAPARERKDSAASRVSALHQKALAAASRGDCAAVRATGNAIRDLDPTYHRTYFARDARLQSCLTAAGKK